MPGLLIIAHTPLASSLKAVAQHAFPEKEPLLQALDVPPEMPPAEIEVLAKALLQQAGAQPVLIFTDVFGATPCNVAQRLADGKRVRVLAGVNVPMLWRALCYAAEPLDAVVTRALGGGAQGVMEVLPSPTLQNQGFGSGSGAHDQVDDNHQQ